MKQQFIPYNQRLKNNARENRKNQTSAEKKLWCDVLNNKQCNRYKFTRQKPLNNFIVDFYCSELMLVIEVDGESHANQEEYDKRRSRILREAYNIRIIRYNNNDVLNNIDGISTDLLNKLEQRKEELEQTPPPPLSGGIRRPSPDKRKNFIKELPSRQGVSLLSPPDKGDKGGFLTR